MTRPAASPTRRAFSLPRSRSVIYRPTHPPVAGVFKDFFYRLPGRFRGGRGVEQCLAHEHADLQAVEADHEIINPVVVDDAQTVARLEAASDVAVAVGDALEDGGRHGPAGLILDRRFAEHLKFVEGLRRRFAAVRVERQHLDLVGLFQGDAGAFGQLHLARFGGRAGRHCGKGGEAQHIRRMAVASRNRRGPHGLDGYADSASKADTILDSIPDPRTG